MSAKWEKCGFRERWGLSPEESEEMRLSIETLLRLFEKPALSQHGGKEGDRDEYEGGRIRARLNGRARA